MSAITGIFYRDGRVVKPELIEKMNKRLAHRGPDGSAIWCDGPIAFGHQMLLTTNESLHEKLPFHDEKTDLIITADARIDNRKELSSELDIEDKMEISDSYFILKSYEKWGEKCPEHLLGDFAFAIWDNKENTLFCARDHIGVKPFYYYLSDDMFVFGTEIKALFQVPRVPHEVNELKIAYHLMKVITDKVLTFYEKIYCLPAAHLLTVNQNLNKNEKYWELNPKSRIILNSDEEYIATFLEIFEEAVNCRLRSAFPIGFELSGGLDSSSVVSMAKYILNKENSHQKDINTFSMIFNDFPQVDESYYINKVIDTGGIKPHLICSNKISPLKQINTILWHQEQPSYNPNMSILWNMYKKMQDSGVRIVLGGDGGDEIISHGTNYFRDLALSWQWKKLAREIKNFSEHTNKNFSNTLIKLVILPIIPTNLKNFVNNYFDQSNQNSNKLILDTKFAEMMGGEKYLRGLTFYSLIKEVKTAREFHHFIIDKTSHQSTLEMQDKILSNFFIEPRNPFFDKRLIEFCYAIPNEMKFRLGWDRYIQRVSMQDILPKDIQWRPLKKYFDPVLEKNLLLFEKPFLKEIFCNDNPTTKKYVNSEMLIKLYNDYNSGNGDLFLNRDIWLVTVLHLWLNNCIFSKK